MSVPDFLVLLISVGAACMDVATQRVSNIWIYLGWLSGLFYQIAIHGFAGILYFLLGAAVPIVILFPLFILRMLGPGDIKVLSALGAVMNAAAVLRCMLWAFLFGAILSVLFLICFDSPSKRFRYFLDYLQKTIQTKKITAYYQTGSRTENLHFTVPILMSTILYIGGFY